MKLSHGNLLEKCNFGENSHTNGDSIYGLSPLMKEARRRGKGFKKGKAKKSIEERKEKR